MIIIIGCSKGDDSSDSNSTVAVTPETFGSWSPDFTDQTSNFEQSRTGSAGTKQTRTINVSSSQEIQETNEYEEDLDINSDGDKIDVFNIVNTTYNASESLGSRTDVSNVLVYDQQANVINSNIGWWAGEYYTQDYFGDYEDNGNLIYSLNVDSYTLFQDYPNICYSIVEQVVGAENISDLFNGGNIDGYEYSGISTSEYYVGGYYGIPASDLFTDSYLDSWDLSYVENFDLFRVIIRGITDDGVNYILYTDIYYDSTYDYSWAADMTTADDFLTFAISSDIFDYSILTNNSVLANDIVDNAVYCESSKNNKLNIWEFPPKKRLKSNYNKSKIRNFNKGNNRERSDLFRQRFKNKIKSLINK